MDGWKRREDKEEDVSNYFMTLRNKSMLEIERRSIRSHCM